MTCVLYQNVAPTQMMGLTISSCESDGYESRDWLDSDDFADSDHDSITSSFAHDAASSALACEPRGCPWEDWVTPFSNFASSLPRSCGTISGVAGCIPWLETQFGLGAVMPKSLLSIGLSG